MIPQTTKETIDRFVQYGCNPGGFVTAVLENNLMEAVGRADSENLENLQDICSYIYNKIPGNCWGSTSKIIEWQKLKQEEKKHNNIYSINRTDGAVEA